MLVAIAIPVFTTQLEKSREATDIANVRSAYAGQMAEFIANGTVAPATVTAKQQQAECIQLAGYSGCCDYVYSIYWRFTRT